MAQLIAAGPIVDQGPGYAGCRIVLKLERHSDGRPREFIVHTQRFYEDGSIAYDNGSYLPIRHADECAQIQARAWELFKERCDEKLGYQLANIEADPVRYASILESHKVKGKG